MLWNVYRFNYNSDLQVIECPDNDVIPADLQSVVLAHRFEIEQDGFELLRVRYGSQVFILSKYTQAALVYKGVSYFYTLKISQ